MATMNLTEPLRVQLGLSLKAAREAGHFSAAEVCEKALGLAKGTHVAVSRLERGILATDKVDHLEKLCCYYGKTPDELMPGLGQMLVHAKTTDPAATHPQAQVPVPSDKALRRTDIPKMAEVLAEPGEGKVLGALLDGRTATDRAEPKKVFSNGGTIVDDSLNFAEFERTHATASSPSSFVPEVTVSTEPFFASASSEAALPEAQELSAPSVSLVTGPSSCEEVLTVDNALAASAWSPLRHQEAETKGSASVENPNTGSAVSDTAPMLGEALFPGADSVEAVTLAESQHSADPVPTAGPATVVRETTLAELPDSARAAPHPTATLPPSAQPTSQPMSEPVISSERLAGARVSAPSPEAPLSKLVSDAEQYRTASAPGPTQEGGSVQYRLRKLRLDLKLSPEELAARLSKQVKVAEREVLWWEAAQRRPNPAQLAALAGLAKTTTKWVMTGKA